MVVVTCSHIDILISSCKLFSLSHILIHYKFAFGCAMLYTLYNECNTFSVIILYYDYSNI